MESRGQFPTRQAEEHRDVQRIAALVGVDASAFAPDHRFDIREDVSSQESEVDDIEVDREVRIPVELLVSISNAEMRHVDRRQEPWQETGGAWRRRLGSGSPDPDPTLQPRRESR